MFCAAVLAAAAITSLQQPAVLLDALQVGDALRGTIVHRHNRKLFLEVPVEHLPNGIGSNEKPKLITAYTPSLPPSHSLLMGDSIGDEVTVYVKRVQTASARLCVGLRDPSVRQKAAAAANSARRLEDLSIGEAIEGSVVSVKPFGTFIDCRISRRARGGVRKMLDAFLPRDQMDLSDAPLQLGQRLEVRVLNPSEARGRLLVTARALSTDQIERLLAERNEKSKRDRRRPGFASFEPGTEREGGVVKLEDFGVIVNVGARKPGLIHISQLRSAGPRGGGFVGHPSEVCDVGDRVVVKVLPRTSARRLSLRLVKVFPRNQQELGEQRATLRRGETLTPRFVRAEDETTAAEDDGGAATTSAASTAAEEGEAEDPFAWASSAGDDDEEEDPWAWAAAGPEVDEGDEEDNRAEAGEAPDFDDDYFNDKYDVDFY